MSRLSSLSVLLALPLLACSSSEEPSESDSGATDTAPSDVVLDRYYTVNNCNTNAPIEGLELCDSPIETGVETCGTTDANGQVMTTWINPPLATNVSIKTSHSEYPTVITTGHYDEDGYNTAVEIIEEGGRVEGTLCSFNKSTSDDFMAGGDLTPEEGMGQIWFGLYSNDNDDVSGAVVESTNAEGELVDQVMYQGGVTGALNPEATTTSGRGRLIGYNLLPGDYTVTVVHDSLDCVSEAWAFQELEPNVIPVPVEANTWTNAFVDCSPR